MSRMRRWAREENEDIVNPSEMPELFEGEVDVGTPEIVEELSSMMDYQEEQGEASEEIAQVNDVLDNAVTEDTPLDDTGAALLQIQVESINRRLGLSGARLSVARENFRGAGTRSTSTRFAREDIKTMLSNIWAKIKAFFKKIWKKIKDWWKGFFDANVKLRNRAQALLDKSKKLSKNSDSEDISADGIPFAFGGRKFKPEYIDTILKNHVTLLDGVQGIVAGAKTISTSIKGTSDDKDSINKAVSAFIDGDVKKIFTVTANDSKITAGTGKAAGDIVGKGASGELFNNQVCGYASYGMKHYGSKDTVDGHYLEFIDTVFEDDRDSDSDDTIEACPLETQRRICQTVIDVAKRLEAITKNQSKIDDLEKAFDSAFTKAEKAARDAKKETTTTASRYAREVGRVTDGPFKGKYAGDYNGVQKIFETVEAAKKYEADGDISSPAPESTEAPETPPVNDDQQQQQQQQAADTTVTGEAHAHAKTIGSVGSFIARATSTIMKDSYKASVKALNYVAKSQSTFKTV